MLSVNSEFIDEIGVAGGFNASACLNCGSCTALCPMGISLLPRMLFRYVLLGAKDRLLENGPSIFSCLLCKMCEDNCPAGVHIAENVRTLRAYISKNVYGLSRS